MGGHRAARWLRVWAELYPEKDYDRAEYGELIANHKIFAANDFIRIGKWKDGARTESKWKANVDQVAYQILTQAAWKCQNVRKEVECQTFWTTGPTESTPMNGQLDRSRNDLGCHGRPHYCISLAEADSQFLTPE